MNFNSNEFAIFTRKINGQSIFKKYPYSIGKALSEFIINEPNRNVVKFTDELLQYYKNIYYKDINYSNSTYKHLLKVIDMNKYDIKELDPLISFIESNKETKFKNTIKKEMNRLFHDLRIKDSNDITRSANCIIGFTIKYMLIKYNKLNEAFNINNLDIRKLKKVVKKTLENDGKMGINGISKELISSLLGVINAVNLMRDKYSDAHSNISKDIPMGYAILYVHAAFTIVNFLFYCSRERADFNHYINHLAELYDTYNDYRNGDTASDERYYT